MSTRSRKNSQNLSIIISSSLQSFKQVMGINLCDSIRHHHHATTENTQKYPHHHSHLRKQKLQRNYSRHQNKSNQHGVNSKRDIANGNVRISQQSVDNDGLFSVNDMLSLSLSEKKEQIASTSDIVTRHRHFCSVRHNKTNSNNSNNISSTALIYMRSYSPANFPLPYISAVPSSKLSTLCTNCYTTCYNITLTAYNKITIMQLKCKTDLNRSINIGKTSDRRYLCLLLLLVLIYWNTIIHAAVAANVTDVVKIYNTALSTSSLSRSLPLPVSTNQQSREFVSNLSSFKLQGREHFAYNLTFNVRRLLIRRDTANVPDDEDNDQYDDEFHEYEILINNKSAIGKYIGAPCNDWKCETSLIHVTCNKETNTCSCEKNYPVQVGLIKGCDKPKKLGEQCFYDETCQYNDENSLCVQVRHNAMCQCASGFHSVSYTKPSRRVFCTQDLDELNSGVPTLLGVCLGIAVLAGLICMVLHLFSKTKYPRHRNYGDANLPPPIMYSSETGSRRPSLASVHSTSSSVRSYSMMRFEKEQQQKEIRHEMKLRLARLQQQQHQQQHQQQLGQHRPQIIVGDTLLLQHGASLNRITMATPSPLTPNSMDELLPAVDETQEYLPKIENKTITTEASVASNTLTTLNRAITSSINTTNQVGNSIAETDTPSAAAYVGPCSSSNETL